MFLLLVGVPLLLAALKPSKPSGYYAELYRYGRR